jgi:hypothetical protein
MRLFCPPMAKVSLKDVLDSLSVNLAFWDMCEYLYRQSGLGRTKTVNIW